MMGKSSLAVIGFTSDIKVASAGNRKEGARLGTASPFAISPSSGVPSICSGGNSGWKLTCPASRAPPPVLSPDDPASPPQPANSRMLIPVIEEIRYLLLIIIKHGSGYR